MRIKIVHMTQTADGQRATFACRCGSGIAHWTCTSVPTIDQALDAEIDIALPIDLSKTAAVCEERQFSLSHDGSHVTFVGSIEGQDDDGVSYLRLGIDCLIMVESAEAGLTGQWLKLKVPAESVSLTPTGW